MDVAGLVLTVIPLVLKGLREINDASRKFLGYRRALGRIVQKLEVETLKLNNTCRNLLQDLMTADKLQMLMEGKGWDDPDLLTQLADRLGAHGTEIFKHHMLELNSHFSDLHKELNMTDDLKPALMDKETRRRLLKKLKFVSREQEYKDLLSRVYQINADLATLTMQQTRPTEIQLSKRTRTLPEAYNLVREYATKLHGLFQNKFQEAPACSCVTAHVVNLRLQGILDKQAQNVGAVRFKIIFSFDRKTAMISRVPWDWQETELPTTEAPTATSSGTATNLAAVSTLPIPGSLELESAPQRKRDWLKEKFSKFSAIFETQDKAAPTKNTPKNQPGQTLPSPGASAPPKKKVSFGVTPKVSFITPAQETAETTPPLPLDLAKELMNLCQAENHPSKYSVGILDPGCGRWHRLQPLTAPSAVSYMSETVSLQDLLRQNVLTLLTRLELGVQLASAVVQLHGTEWLGESWTSEQIFFFVRQDVQRRAPDGKTWFQDPIIDKPFVRRAFGGSNRLSQPLQASKLEQVADYDKCLFSLGIVLIELWFGRCFSDLKSSPDLQNSNILAAGDHGDYMAARHWTGKLTAESGESYLLAVMRCLGMSRPESSRYARRSLEDLTYKIEVHETVVKILEENYQTFATAVPDD